MFDYIRTHALKNVWCSPDQDKQFVFKPARISRGIGAKNSVRVMWDTFSLPTKNEFYHVYQIGQIHPILIGLVEDVYRWHSNPTNPLSSDKYSGKNIWIPFTDICTQKNLVADLYIESGLQFPRFSSYVMVTDDKNLLIAVKETSKIKVGLHNENFYIRLYSNAFFSSDRSVGYPHRIVAEGKKIPVANYATEIVNYWNYIQAFKAVRGEVFVCVNGVLVDALTVAVAGPNDIVDFYYDSTVTRSVEITLSDMETFDSTLDSKYKYLITYPESDVNDQIEYHDDIEFYLIKKTGSAFKGSYYHKNTSDTVRMVTHKDYSIPVPFVVSYSESIDVPFLGDVNAITLKMWFRESGYDRPLVNETNRIKELYKLTDQDVTDAMVGIDSTLVNWQADTLENSAYTRIMRSRGVDVTKQMVESAYGYNAISKLIADTPNPVEIISSLKTVVLPIGLAGLSTIYEYDVNGVLIDKHPHSNDVNYFPHSINTEMVEGIMGQATNQLDCVFGQQTVPLSPYLSYRMYKTRLIADVIQDNEWEDVTGSTDYVITGNNLIWAIDLNDYYVCVKSDLKFLDYDLVLDPEDHLLTFTVASLETHGVDVIQRPMYIPPGKIDIWLNEKYLIENLDYYVQWPLVVVTNKEYLIEGETEQRIKVRGTGFCRPDMTLEPATEFGYVVNKVLSKNNIYDVRDDRVLQIVVEGKLKQREDLLFLEDTGSVTIPDVRNGAPYVIKDYIIPMRDATITDTYTLRNQSKIIDQNVSNYLTAKLGEVAPPGPNIIPNLYNVFSPFASKIIYDILNGIFIQPGILGHYSEMDIASWLSGYMWLLDYDPCRKDINFNYVSIHPHPLYTELSLTIHEYKFMERVIALYLFNKVDLTHFITVRIV